MKQCTMQCRIIEICINSKQVYCNNNHNSYIQINCNKYTIYRTFFLKKGGWVANHIKIISLKYVNKKNKINKMTMYEYKQRSTSHLKNKTTLHPFVIVWNICRQRGGSQKRCTDFPRQWRAQTPNPEIQLPLSKRK